MESLDQAEARIIVNATNTPGDATTTFIISQPGSYYLTGFLHERPLARLREDLGRIGIARADGVVEPEDHAGILCEIMSGLVSRRLAAPPDSDRLIFDKHMAPWIGRFFVDLENAEAADFYRQVGTLGRVFTGIETEAFAMPA